MHLVFPSAYWFQIKEVICVLKLAESFVLSAIEPYMYKLKEVFVFKDRVLCTSGSHSFFKAYSQHATVLQCCVTTENSFRQSD